MLCEDKEPALTSSTDGVTSSQWALEVEAELLSLVA